MGVYVFFFAGLSNMSDIPSKRMDAILVNVPMVRSSTSAIPYMRKLFKYAGANQIMMDSGGFQIYRTLEKKGKVRFDPSKRLIIQKKELNIAPIHVVETAVELKPHIMVGLDYPVIKTSDPKEQRKEFLTKRRRNLRWMGEMVELRRKYCPEIELYLPIQCYNLSQFSYFEKTLNNLKYDGLSLPIRNMNAERISEFLLKFHKIGVRKVHVLGTSSLMGISLTAYFARNLFERCSVDGASWAQHAHNHSYIIPGSLLSMSVGRNSTVNNRVRLTCGCTKCRGKTFGDIKRLADGDRRNLLMFHNFYVIKKTGEALYKHAGNPGQFEAYLRKKAAGRTKYIDSIVRAISMIR